MIKNIIKQLLNQKQANAWIWIELIVVISLLWYGVDILFNYQVSANQYRGYDTEDVFNIQMRSNAYARDSLKDESHVYETQILNLISKYKGVKAICYYSGAVPYKDYIFEGYATHTDSTRAVNCYVRYVSPTYFDVFNVKPLIGKINKETWNASEYPTPTVMSEQMNDSLFKTRNSLGKTFFNPYFINSSHPESNYVLKAVVANTKNSDYEKYDTYLYMPTSLDEFYDSEIAVKVNHDDATGFVDRFRRDMEKKLAIGPYYLYDIDSYDDMKNTFDLEMGTTNYINTVYSIILFFMFNVFLGMLGTFWFRTRKRRGEIALRMALGSTRKGIFEYYTSEGLILLLFAMIPALVICINIQYLDLTVNTLIDASVFRFIVCFLISVLILAAIITIGICFPANKAMKIKPAEALHDE